ncbi:MAG TPA: hypothetical protein VH114_10790 [Candidatus Acidoferrum sp.]|nr:hypothetical protein [Candidatus Acidoferrum sp.]
MRILLMVLLLSASSCFAQEVPQPVQPPADAPDQTPADQTQRSITVPAGTRVQLALANPIRARAARAGEIVRAVTTFPVTVGKDLAIPQGTFVEGNIVKVGKRGSTRFDGLEIKFTYLVFTNGYNAELDGSVAEAKAIFPSANQSGGTETVGLTANNLQQGPTPPPLPQVGPPKGPIIGGVLGGMAVFVVTGILLGRRHSRGEPADFDTGFQFEMVLQTPLTLDGTRVAAAVSAPGAN